MMAAERNAMSPQCPLCGSSRQTKRFALGDWHLLRCEECGLFHRDPYATSDQAAHANVQDPGAQDPASMSSHRKRLYDIQFDKRHFDFIADRCTGAKSILDVGCGTGLLLELLADRPGLQRTGIELDPRRAQFAEIHAKCQIHQAPIEQFAGDAKFDVITLIDVLSHIRSFDGLFGSLTRLLADNGKIIIKAGQFAPDVRKNDVRDWSLAEHFHFLGLGTIEHICRRYGLVALEHHPTSYSKEMYSRESFGTPSKSPPKRMLKKAIAAVPGALALLAAIHDVRHKNRVRSGFMVLRRA